MIQIKLNFVLNILILFLNFLHFSNGSAQQITDNLFLGDCDAAHDESFLKKNRIQLIVTVTPATECSTPPFHLLVEHKRFDLLDDGMHKIQPILNILTEKLKKAEIENKNVLLHCKHGISRSPAVAIAYLILSRDWSLKESFAHVKDIRPEIQPRFQLFDELMHIEMQHLHLASPSVTHAVNYVPITIPPPQTNCDQMIVSSVNTRGIDENAIISSDIDANELLAGSLIQDKYLLTAKVRNLHELTVHCEDEAHCDQLALPSSDSRLQWPRCTVRVEDDKNQMSPYNDQSSITASKQTQTIETTTLQEWHAIDDNDVIYQHRYELRQRVGQGRFGEVWRATSIDLHDSFNYIHSNNEKRIFFVLKRLFVEKGDNMVDSGRREAFFGNYLNENQFIARFVEQFQDNDEFYLVFRDEGTSLHDLLYSIKKVASVDYVRVVTTQFWKYLRIDSNGKLLFKKIIYSVLKALNFIHKQGIVHRDIKPENILIASERFDNGTFEHSIRICDFGSAISKQSLHLYESQASFNDITVDYAPPEALARVSQSHLNPAFDIWSLGVVFLEIIFGSPNVFTLNNREHARISRKYSSINERNAELFKASLKELCILPQDGEEPCNDEKFAQTIANRDVLGKGRHLDANAISLLKSMLQFDPLLRISAEIALKHPYFDDI